MLSLPSVTLLLADTVNHRLALRALELSCKDIEYARVVFLTNELPDGIDAPDGIELLSMNPLASRDDYSQLLLKGLLPYIDTAHVLIAQWDGYVVNADAWSDDFLHFDYIGAKWPEPPPGFRVGNGGFSLRSRRLLEALQHPAIQLREAEDVTICQAFRSSLESVYAIKFADEQTADCFSFEMACPAAPAFGFHGLYNFCRVMSESDLVRLAPSLSDEIAMSKHMLLLLRNCVELQRWNSALAIAQRVLSARPDDVEVRGLASRLETHLAQPHPVARNNLCPCGSGMRYKSCHGALPAN